MTQQEIIKGNKLIAEFMKIPKCDRCYHSCEHYKFGSSVYYKPEQMSYATSWDWLKPVVHEISTYGLAHKEQVQEIINMSIVVEISACWLRCVKFITWLNTVKS